MLVCRPSMDKWVDSTLPVCTTMDQLGELEKAAWVMNNVEQKIIINKTGCMIPCTYKEYSMVGTPNTGSGANFHETAEK